jgi:hypothetical protein
MTSAMDMYYKHINSERNVPSDKRKPTFFCSLIDNPAKI